MKRLATSLRALAWAAAFLALAAAAVSIVQPQFRGQLGVMNVIFDTPDIQTLPADLRAVAVVVPALCFAYAMWQLAGLLRLAARNEVFSAPAAVYLRRFGVWLLITTLADKLALAAAKILDFFLNHGGRGSLKFSLSSEDIWNVFLSALFMLVARVIADAYRIAEENRQII